jgi:hypothetical protein
VPVKEIRVCIVDDAGKIIRELKVVSEPEAALREQTAILHRRCWPWSATIMCVRGA